MKINDLNSVCINKNWIDKRFEKIFLISLDGKYIGSFGYGRSYDNCVIWIEINFIL